MKKSPSAATASHMKKTKSLSTAAVGSKKVATPVKKSPSAAAVGSKKAAAHVKKSPSAAAASGVKKNRLYPLLRLVTKKLLLM